MPWVNLRPFSVWRHGRWAWPKLLGSSVLHLLDLPGVMFFYWHIPKLAREG